MQPHVETSAFSPQRYITAMAEFAKPEGLSRLMSLYADDAVFEDPIQRIDGRPRIERAFKAFLGLAETMDVILLRSLADESSASLLWRIRLVTRRGPSIVIEGSTWADFRDGRVVWHRDYWDTFETLGLTFPSLASALRKLRGTPRMSG
jgi:hypothetical protein